MSESRAAADFTNVHVLLNDLLDVFDVYKDVLRANTVDFYTHNRIDLLQKANPRLLDEMKNLSGEGIVRLACGEFNLEEERKQRKTEESFPEVCKLSRQSRIRCERLETAGQRYHPNAAKFTQSLELQKGACEDVLVKPKEFMNLKKSHEVTEMSQLCSSLIQSQQLKKVIDIGSGKGYLSQYLTLQFGVRVIGIDSSSTNTHGAKERGKKLARHWKTFIRRATENQTELNTNTDQPSQQSSINEECLKPDALSDTVSHGHKACHCVNSTSAPDCQSPDSLRDVPQLSSLAKDAVTVTKATADERKKPHNRTKYTDVKSHTSWFEPVTAFVSSATDLESLAGSSDVTEENGFSNDDVPRLSSLAKDAVTLTKATADERKKPHNRNKYTDVKSHTSRFEPVTAFVSSATDLESLAGSSDVTEEENAFSNDPFLLVGLHTCGDLGSTVARLFTDSESAVAMCFVPCCYHFVSEEFEPKGSQFWREPLEPDQCGFPMSRYLTDKKVNIGRDAKMLACMAQERMAADGEIPVRSLFFRAVLQVLFRDRYRIPSRQEAVGKLASKCKDFVDYTRRAMKKLGFEHEKMTDEEINQYYEDYLEKMNSLEIFTAARLAFARMVESLLLLDKLCFLMEQPHIESAAIVRLFDPVLSPRCYAVVATRRRL